MKKGIFIAIVTTLLVASCSTDNSTPIEGANDNANQGNKYAKRIEVPALNESDFFLTHTTTVNGKENVTYSVSHNAERKHCRWVAFTFDPSNRSIKWQRDNWNSTEWGGDPFQPCPDLPENYVFTKSEINGNGYVRGHIVASYDRVYSKDANEQTFYYSNISPMLSRFNTGLWSSLENAVQKWGRNTAFSDTLYIVKGGTIAEGLYSQKGTCRTVPDYYFMALLAKKGSIYNAVGFLLEHKSYLEGDIWDYAMTINHLEEFTGIDFFCNLPDNLENGVERVFYPNNW